MQIVDVPNVTMMVSVGEFLEAASIFLVLDWDFDESPADPTKGNSLAKIGPHVHEREGEFIPLLGLL